MNSVRERIFVNTKLSSSQKLTEIYWSFLVDSYQVPSKHIYRFLFRKGCVFLVSDIHIILALFCKWREIKILIPVILICIKCKCSYRSMHGSVTISTILQVAVWTYLQNVLAKSISMHALLRGWYQYWKGKIKINNHYFLR